MPNSLAIDLNLEGVDLPLKMVLSPRNRGMRLTVMGVKLK
jgi:hypothetical protein